MSVAERLVEIRKSLDINQGEFAKIFEISQSSYARYETGESLLNSEKMNLLYEKISIDTHWLLTGQGEMFRDLKTDIETSSDKGIKIPLLDVRASAGSGIVNYNEAELEWISIPTVLLKQYNPQFVKLLEVHGDSMKPTFLDGDWILVSTNHRDLQSERVYVIRINNELKVKRLDKDIRGNIIIASDNPAFKTEELTPTEFTDFDIEIVGLVFGVLKKV
ncbi:MAG: XRE family transcriptional regulator [Brevinema sp.]